MYFRLECMPKIPQTNYRKVTSCRLSRLVAHLSIFKLFMKEKFDGYLLCPLAKIIHNWIVDRSTACNFMVLPENHSWSSVELMCCPRGFFFILSREDTYFCSWCEEFQILIQSLAFSSKLDETAFSCPFNLHPENWFWGCHLRFSRAWTWKM